MRYIYEIHINDTLYDIVSGEEELKEKINQAEEHYGRYFNLTIECLIDYQYEKSKDEENN